MLDKVLAIFKSNPVHRLALTASIASNIVKTFEQEFATDHDSKNAAIDTLIALLNSYKNSPQTIEQKTA